MFHIGILQLTQNLDDAVRGFKAGLASLNITAQFYYYNADGNTQALNGLVEKLGSHPLDLCFACSTPAALAALHLPGYVPVVFTPVFDPVGAKLVQSLANPGGKATGVAGMVKAEVKLDFIKRLLPQAKKLGVLYHSADSNALLEVKNITDANQGTFELVLLPVDRPEDLSTLPDLLPADLDALFLPIGRIIEENFASIVYYTDSLNLPVIASHPPNVSAGALGALVANHYQLGRACAAKASEILSGKPVGTIPVGIADQPEVLLNAFTAQNLSIDLPASLLKEAVEIFE
ncbi:ABC transporter substrate-binding protein [Propionispora vibrioides]|uniref:Putative ABC transport system substrate-binding protein n=1 Tax=Propionispora vibrioides TaxID=112903 RepID=A0A1H8XUD1_9FIRM|nr:ABC transporter substrate-binding protein [Propionispora vibrioides]SEP43644.1 putative ABC transport system substrate-binding protein [Propionispora vibrioides]